MNSGVREYWIVDPILDEILVYNFDKTYIPEHYGFSDKVGVGIYDGKCQIDFAEIKEQVRSMLGQD